MVTLLIYRKLYVAGFILSLAIADPLEPFVQSSNSSVIFLKETDIIVTNGAWRIAVDIGVRTYHDIIFTIRQDLNFVEQNKKEFTSISEIRQIESLLQLLESKLSDFHQFYHGWIKVEV